MFSYRKKLKELEKREMELSLEIIKQQIELVNLNIIFVEKAKKFLEKDV